MAIHDIQIDFGGTGTLEFNGQRHGVKAMSIRQNPDSYPFFEGYLIPDVFAQSNAVARRVGRNPEIKRVIFNDPATVVIWADDTKTVVKCQPGDTYSKETGLALCIAKKFLGNKGNFNEVFKKWIPEGDGISVEEMRKSLKDYCWERHCSNCPVDRCIPKHRCGNGTQFCYTRSDGSYDMSDDKIRAAYKVAFGEEG